MTGAGDAIGSIPVDHFIPPDVDLAAAHRSIWCLPHKFIVCVPDKPDSVGGFFIPNKTARRERLPIGIVIAAGDETDLQVGDHVLVESKYAKAVGGLAVGDFRAPGEVWMFGLTSQHVRICSIVGVRHSAIAVVGRTPFAADEADFGGVGCSVLGVEGPSALGSAFAQDDNSKEWRVHDARIKRWSAAAMDFEGDGRVLLELTPKSSMYGMLHVPDRQAERPDIGTVAAVSGQCKLVRPGDRVIYMRRGIESIYPEGKKNMAFAPERAIYAVVRD